MNGESATAEIGARRMANSASRLRAPAGLKGRPGMEEFKQRRTGMPHSPTWKSEMKKWFKDHPDRSYRLTTIPVEALKQLPAGWMVGCSTCSSAPLSFLPVRVVDGDTAVDCVIRAPHAGDGSDPGVFLMDGCPSGSWPKLNSQDEETFARMVWGLVQFADDQQLSVAEVVHNQSLLMMADGCIQAAQLHRSSTKQ